MQQLVTPDLNVKAQYTRCLQYVQNAFGSPNAGPSASYAWDQTAYKHFDTPPTDVFYIAWYEYYGTVDGVYDNWGHVTIGFNGTQYSSPYTAKSTHDTLRSISEVERIYGCTYIGWSEDIAGLKVIQEGVTMPTEQNVRDYFNTYVGTAPTIQQIGFYTARPWTSLATDVCDNQLGKIKELEAGSGQFIETKVYIKK